MRGLVFFGDSNILSDLFDCALANKLPIAHIVLNMPEQSFPRSLTLTERLAALAAHGIRPTVVAMDDFVPEPGQQYFLAPTTPARSVLAAEVERRFGPGFTTLVHPTAYVSPLATLGKGVFVGANSVIGPGARLADHVFVNRGVTVGHDTQIGSFSRIQPGCNIGGVTRIGTGVTMAIGATLVERLVVGDSAVIGAGAVVLRDVAKHVLVVGVPAEFKKALGPQD